MTSYTFINSDHKPSTSLLTKFNIITSFCTDIWRKLPFTHSFTALILHCTLSLSSFLKVYLTVLTNWRKLYNQDELILIVLQPEDRHKWVKANIEFIHECANVSTVAVNKWANWSLLPLTNENNNSVTVKMVNENDDSLWIYIIEEIK